MSVKIIQTWTIQASLENKPFYIPVYVYIITNYIIKKQYNEI